MKDMQDESGIANVFKEAHNKEFYFRIYAKRDDYHGENKLKLQAARVEKISYVKQGKEILNLLNQYNPK